MTIAIRERSDQEIPEGGAGWITCEITDTKGAQIPLASLLTLTVTLFDETTGSSVSGPFLGARNSQSIKNANGGTVTEVGGVTQVTLALSGADNPMVGTDRTEWHVAFFEWTWVGGVAPGRKEYAFRVKNLSRV